MEFPLIILGGGGHAKVLTGTLLLEERRILGYCDLDAEGKAVLGVSRLGGDDVILRFPPETLRLVNGIGSSLRAAVYEKFSDKGYIFEQVIHPSAVLGADVLLEGGVQIMAGAVIQPGTRIAVNAIINTAASVDHDCFIGRHAHVGPGAVLCGHVCVEEGAQIGAGATIVQGVTVGAKSVLGAGSVVLKDIPSRVTAVGVPAHVIKTSSDQLTKPER